MELARLLQGLTVKAEKVVAAGPWGPGGGQTLLSGLVKGSRGRTTGVLSSRDGGLHMRGRVGCGWKLVGVLCGRHPQKFSSDCFGDIGGNPLFFTC